MIQRSLVRSYSPEFAADDAHPVAVEKDVDLVTLGGMARNVVEAHAPDSALWFTVPDGYRPAKPAFGHCYVQGSGIFTYAVYPSGAVAGLGMVVGDPTVSAARYWSFDLTYKAA